MPLINKLKEFRMGKGLNQEDLGKIIGVSRQTISSIERGDYTPSIIICLKLAKEFKVAVEDIFNYTEG
ncbi:helix-turn-helix transcriptional regulator [Peptoniphilaceae bacterium SGI.131]